MPSALTKTCRAGTCSSRATANGYCDRHQDAKKEHKRLFDRYRADDPIRQLYRTKRWQSVRLIVLRRDILCKACGHQAATVGDHIMRAREIVDTFGVDAFYDADRIQGLCKKCHDSKTSVECGWAGKHG